MNKYLTLLLIVIVGLGIDFFTSVFWLSLIVKLLVFVFFSFLLYQLQENLSVVTSTAAPEELEGYFEAEISPKRNKLFDIASSTWLNIYTESHELKEFAQRQFDLAMNQLLPNNGYLLLTSQDGNAQLLIRKREETLNKENFENFTRVLTLLESSNGFFLENDIKNGHHLFPFYEQSAYTVNSVFALVSDLSATEKLVWIFDAKTAGHFNNDDALLLKESLNNTALFFENLVLLNAAEQEKADVFSLLELADDLNTAKSLEAVIDKASQVIIERLTAAKLSISLVKNKETEAPTIVIKKAIGGQDPYRNGFEYSYDGNTLNSWVISKNKTYVLPNIERDGHFIPRYSEEEKSNFGLKSFLAVPVQQGDKAIGSICLESEKENYYTEIQKNNLKQISEIFSRALYRFSADH
jgi:hypothetical protein